MNQREANFIFIMLLNNKRRPLIDEWCALELWCMGPKATNRDRDRLKKIQLEVTRNGTGNFKSDGAA